ncbi:putative membrane protein [Jannaschia faecimaris]|uniref:Putative membrane protein n=1 Tax=Jannaschia faecimaris TaxID=1244108 RepID=A0A1H3LFI7_9RHOB|nr:TIGR01620 family protein [Jannaschia faecimaris]SDY62929.1 putative membrane protein [Jannaschia faecimaris]
MTDTRRRAVLFDLDEDTPPTRPDTVKADGDAPPLDPASAPPVPDDEIVPPASGRAMQTVALLATRRERGLAGWFFGLLGALLTFALSIAMWNFVTGLLAANPVLGWVATALVASFIAICLVIVLRELAALSRLKRIDGFHRDAAAVADLTSARKFADRLAAFYAGRPDTRWGREELAARKADVFDADAMLALTERSLLAPLDAAATREVEAAARQVALVTAVVPLALADVVAALTSNLRMIRRIALIYGGRGGTLGSWRLAKTVLTHLAATGAVAVGDDLIHSVAGGGVLSKISRRFGEGVVNGALTARVGLAAMEVCRPLPFTHERPPRITAVVQRALTGLFGQKDT